MSTRFVLRDVIDSPPEHGLEFSNTSSSAGRVTNTTTTTTTTNNSASKSANSSGLFGTGHRPGVHDGSSAAVNNNNMINANSAASGGGGGNNNTNNSSSNNNTSGSSGPAAGTTNTSTSNNSKRADQINSATNFLTSHEHVENQMNNNNHGHGLLQTECNVPPADPLLISPSTATNSSRGGGQTGERSKSKSPLGRYSSSAVAAAAIGSGSNSASKKKSKSTSPPVRKGSPVIITSSSSNSAQKKQQSAYANLAAQAAQASASGGGAGGSRNFLNQEHREARRGVAAAHGSGGGDLNFDSDLLSSINTSTNSFHENFHFPAEFRSALSKALFKLEAAEKTIAEQQRTINTERSLFQERISAHQKESEDRFEKLEHEASADRTYLVQAKHDRDRFDRQYHDLLELAERREQEQQSESNRWENERQILTKRVDETANNTKNLAQLLDAAQARVRSLTEQLADRDARLSQLQNECEATRTETAGYERKIREGLLVDARISQKWLSEADTAKRDNQALCSSLVRAMNLLARTVEYGNLVTKGALGEGFVYCGADPNVNFGSANVQAASANASVLESLVRDTNSLIRNSSVPPHFGLPGSNNNYDNNYNNNNHNNLPSCFDSSMKPTGLRVERLRSESDFWIPKPAYDLLNRLLGWMEQSCALKITPQVEQQLLPALHEWFVVLNAVWRERLEEKVRATAHAITKKLERERQQHYQQNTSSVAARNSISRFSSTSTNNNNNNNVSCCSSEAGVGLGNGGGESNHHHHHQPEGSSSNWNAPPTVSIPVRRTSERLKMRIDEAKRHSWSVSQHAGGGNNNNNSGGMKMNSSSSSSSNGPLIQKWSSIAIDSLQSILDLEKTMQANQKQLSRLENIQQQQKQQNQNPNSSAACGGGGGGRDQNNSNEVVVVDPRFAVDCRQVEEGLRLAAEPVSFLQTVSEQLKTHIEEFRDALHAADPGFSSGSSSVPVTSSSENDESSSAASRNKHQEQQQKVPFALLKAVHHVSTEFCDAIEDSSVSISKVQFDIDRAMNFISDVANGEDPYFEQEEKQQQEQEQGVAAASSSDNEYEDQNQYQQQQYPQQQQQQQQQQKPQYQNPTASSAASAAAGGDGVGRSRGGNGRGATGGGRGSGKQQQQQRGGGGPYDHLNRSRPLV